MKVTTAQVKKRTKPGTQLRLVQWDQEQVNKLVTVEQVSTVWFVVTGAEPDKRTFVLWPKQPTPTGFEAVRQGHNAATGRVVFVWEHHCAYCGEPIVGSPQAGIHRDGFCEGPEVYLCDTCGLHPEPTCEAIWDKISHTRSS